MWPKTWLRRKHEDHSDIQDAARRVDAQAKELRNVVEQLRQMNSTLKERNNHA